MSNYNNEFKKHKTSDMIKWIVVFLLIFALCGSVVGIGLKMFGVFDKKTEIPGTEVVEGEAPDDVFLVNPVSTEHVKLLATAVASAGPEYDSDAQTHLTATVEPENAEDKSMDWSIAFKNPASTWATGKTVTDYVKLTPVSDGALEADVKGLKPFGEQIVITCRARANSEAYATCTVDYIKRYKIGGAPTSSAGHLNMGFTVSDGTIDCTNTMAMTIAFDATVYAKYQEIFKKQGFESELLPQTVATKSMSVSGASVNFDAAQVKGNSPMTVYSSYSKETKNTFFKDFFQESAISGIVASPEKHNKATAAIREFLDYVKTQLAGTSGSNFSIYKVNFTLTSKNTTYNFTNVTKLENVLLGYDTTKGATFETIKNSILDVVSGVELSQGSIIF